MASQLNLPARYCLPGFGADGSVTKLSSRACFQILASTLMLQGNQSLAANADIERRARRELTNAPSAVGGVIFDISTWHAQQGSPITQKVELCGRTNKSCRSCQGLGCRLWQEVEG